METTTTTTSTTTMPQITTHTPPTKRLMVRSHPYSKPILLSGDRRSRKRKSLTWPSEDKIHKVHYFEYIVDERINVTRLNTADQANSPNASTTLPGGPSLNANNKMPIPGGVKISTRVDSDKCMDYVPWQSLILIDYTPELPSPGWNSIERSAQAERENYVLGAIDLPGQPSTLDEPDQQSKQGANDSNVIVKEVPLDNPEGTFREYTDMYSDPYCPGYYAAQQNMNLPNWIYYMP